MSCCFGKNTDAIEPKKSLSDQSDSPSDRLIIPVNKPEDNKIEYSITVKTGDFRNSGTNGPVYIKIFGRDNKQTEDLLLSESDKPFTQGCTRKFQVNAIDIGKPQRIIIRHEDKSTGWYVDYVEISVHNFLIRFVANRWLNQLKNDQKLEMELFGSEQPAVLYNIEVQTGDEQIEPLDSPVYMQIYGTTTTTPKFFLESKNAIFTKNSTSKFSISSNNVGEIQRIIIGHEGLGKVNDWYLKQLNVQMLSQQQEYTIDKWLSPTKGNQRLFIELSKESPPIPSIYFINIQTVDINQTNINENIEMIIRGSNGEIGKFLLKNYAKYKDKQLFQKGNNDQFEIEHENIGNIENLTIGFSDTQQTSAWFIEHINIKYNETIYHFRAQCWLSNRLGPDFSWITLKPNINNDDIKYKIVIETGQSGIDANVILCIFGDEETTTNLGLKTTKDGFDAKFEKDSILEFDVQAIDVGKIKKINIGHDGKGDEQQWFLKTIQIEKNDELYIFKANQLLNEEKAFIDLLPDETKTSTLSSALKKDQSNYKITIVTSSEENSGTDSGVLMTIFGDKDITKQFQLINDKENTKELFATGTTNEFEMELDDVGNINKINIGQDGKGLYQNWHLESVQIQKGTESYNFLANKMLDQSTSFIDLTPTQTRKPSTPEPEKIKSPSPEPVKIESSSPEPTKPKTPTPEPTKVRTPTPEPVKVKIPTPEPTKIKSPSPEPVKPKTPTPEPTKFKTPTPELVKPKTPTPEPTKLKTPTSEPVKAKKPHSVMPEQKAPSTKEVTYKILLQTGSNHEEGENSHLYLTIFGQNGQTKKIPLNENNKVNKKIPFKKNEKIDFELKTNDVGKISKILLNQDSNEQGIIWHINNLTIKRNNETTTFNIDRKFEQNTELEFTPSPLLKRTESPRKPMKTSETITKLVVKPKETDYDIIISTGDQAIEAPVILKIRGENGIVNILLTKTKTGEKPFQSNSTQEFTQKTTDVGKIKRITIEHQGTDLNLLWHIQTIQIKKGNETYNFNANVHLDYKDNKVNLYPVGALFGHQREDYVQSELRRLRESLRTESAKLRPPPHKAYEPFVYNDLSPYFDTTPVERAIYSPLDAPPGYYTRFTALRVVEPWEAYEMDYGVSYKLLKQRKGRSISAKRSVSKSEDESIDRKQGSTHLPKFPCVSMQKPAEYSRPLTMNDVPKIRSFIRSRYTAQAENQIEKDYKRTHDDIYRMQLDNLTAYHESNRNNMVQVYHSYLENTPGSKKAIRELSDQVAVNNTKSSVQTTA